MKILYVGDKYDYMIQDRGLSYGYYNFYDSLVRMDGGRNEVAYVPVDEMVQRDGARKTNEKLLQIADGESPRLIFFAIGGEIGDIVQKETLEALRRKAPTVAWMPDDQWAFEAYSKHWAPFFSWVVTTDYKALAKYKNIGYEHVINSQWACNHWLYKKLPLPKIYEVSFVGSRHGNRGEMVQRIRREGINVQCWGSGWPSGRVSQEKMMEIFSQSKICLNFTKNSGVLRKELGYLFVRRRMYDGKVMVNSLVRVVDNIKAFPACMWNNQMKGRNFEIPACGSFCLTEYADGLTKYYEIGKEIECFSRPQEAVEKIRYYLAHDQEREEIARAGYECTLRDHTYEKRFQEIFQIIGLEK